MFSDMRTYYLKVPNTHIYTEGGILYVVENSTRYTAKAWADAPMQNKTTMRQVQLITDVLYAIDNAHKWG